MSQQHFIKMIFFFLFFVLERANPRADGSVGNPSLPSWLLPLQTCSWCWGTDLQPGQLWLLPSFEGFVWDVKGWEEIPGVAAQGCEHQVLPIPILGLGKVGIPQETLPCPSGFVFGVGKNPSGSFMSLCLGCWGFLSALLCLGRAQLCPDVPRLVEQILQQHLPAGLEPQQGQSCGCCCGSKEHNEGCGRTGSWWQILDFSIAGMGNDPTFPSLCQRPEIPVLFLLFLPFQAQLLSGGT